MTPIYGSSHRSQPCTIVKEYYITEDESSDDSYSQLLERVRADRRAERSEQRWEAEMQTDDEAFMQQVTSAELRGARYSHFPDMILSYEVSSFPKTGATESSTMKSTSSSI